MMPDLLNHIINVCEPESLEKEKVLTETEVQYSKHRNKKGVQQ
jgi:hypothetical protein